MSAIPAAATVDMTESSTISLPQRKEHAATKKVAIAPLASCLRCQVDPVCVLQSTIAGAVLPHVVAVDIGPFFDTSTLRCRSIYETASFVTTVDFTLAADSDTESDCTESDGSYDGPVEMIAGPPPCDDLPESEVVDPVAVLEAAKNLVSITAFEPLFSPIHRDHLRRFVRANAQRLRHVTLALRDSAAAFAEGGGGDGVTHCDASLWPTDAALPVAQRSLPTVEVVTVTQSVWGNTFIRALADGTAPRLHTLRFTMLTPTDLSSVRLWELVARISEGRLPSLTAVTMHNYYTGAELSHVDHSKVFEAIEQQQARRFAQK